MTTNPATLISAGTAPAPTIPAGYAAVGIITVLAVLALYVAHRTRGVTKSLRKEQDTLAATSKAVQAIRKPGSLTADAVHAAHARAEDQRANLAAQARSESEAVLARLRPMRRPAEALSLLPLPEVHEPTRPAPFRP